MWRLLIGGVLTIATTACASDVDTGFTPRGIRGVLRRQPPLIAPNSNAGGNADGDAGGAALPAATADVASARLVLPTGVDIRPDPENPIMATGAWTGLEPLSVTLTEHETPGLRWELHWIEQGDESERMVSDESVPPDFAAPLVMPYPRDRLDRLIAIEVRIELFARTLWLLGDGVTQEIEDRTLTTRRFRKPLARR